jgi:tRNA (guanine-N7-)-methyltransferase
MAAVEALKPTKQTVIVRPPSYVDRWDIHGLFAQPQPIEVELGAGDGSFFVQWAAQNPNTNFIGLERLLGRLKKIEKKSRRLGLTNVRGLRLEAVYFTEYILPRASVSAFHIYFPDPWPKRKHRQNRLINERFTELLRAALVKQGIVYLRTDDADYFSQMTRVFDANKNFTAIPTPERLANVLTDFERQFTTQGIQTNRAAYQRIV